MIVEYDFNGNEVSRYDLKSMHNLNQVENFEIDINDNRFFFGCGILIIVCVSNLLISNLLLLKFQQM